MRRVQKRVIALAVAADSELRAVQKFRGVDVVVLEDGDPAVRHVVGREGDGARVLAIGHLIGRERIVLHRQFDGGVLGKVFRAAILEQFKRIGHEAIGRRVLTNRVVLVFGGLLQVGEVQRAIVVGGRRAGDRHIAMRVHAIERECHAGQLRELFAFRRLDGGGDAILGKFDGDARLVDDGSVFRQRLVGVAGLKLNLARFIRGGVAHRRKDLGDKVGGVLFLNLFKRQLNARQRSPAMLVRGHERGIAENLRLGKAAPGLVVRPVHILAVAIPVVEGELRAFERSAVLVGLFNLDAGKVADVGERHLHGAVRRAVLVGADGHGNGGASVQPLRIGGIADGILGVPRALRGFLDPVRARQEADRIAAFAGDGDRVDRGAFASLSIVDIKGNALVLLDKALGKAAIIGLFDAQEAFAPVGEFSRSAGSAAAERAVGHLDDLRLCELVRFLKGVGAAIFVFFADLFQLIPAGNEACERKGTVFARGALLRRNLHAGLRFHVAEIARGGFDRVEVALREGLKGQFELHPFKEGGLSRIVLLGDGQLADAGVLERDLLILTAFDGEGQLISVFEFKVALFRRGEGAGAHADLLHVVHAIRQGDGDSAIRASGNVHKFNVGCCIVIEESLAIRARDAQRHVRNRRTRVVGLFQSDRGILHVPNGDAGLDGRARALTAEAGRDEGLLAAMRHLGIPGGDFRLLPIVLGAGQEAGEHDDGLIASHGGGQSALVYALAVFQTVDGNLRAGQRPGFFRGFRRIAHLFQHDGHAVAQFVDDWAQLAARVPVVHDDGSILRIRIVSGIASVDIQRIGLDAAVRIGGRRGVGGPARLDKQELGFVFVDGVFLSVLAYERAVLITPHTVGVLSVQFMHFDGFGDAASGIIDRSTRSIGKIHTRGELGHALHHIAVSIGEPEFERGVGEFGLRPIRMFDDLVQFHLQIADGAGPLQGIIPDAMAVAVLGQEARPAVILPQRFFKARRSLDFDEPVHIFDDGFLSIPNDGAGARQRAGGKGAFAGSRGRAGLVDIIAVEVFFQSLCGLRAGSV